MAGVLDLHTLLAVQNGWQFYMDNQVKWRGLFRGIQPDVLDSWFTYLTENPVTFRSHQAQGTGDFPCVVVQLINESNESGQEPLGGFFMTETDTKPIYTMLMRQSVRISVFASTPEMARCMHVTARAIMQGSIPSMLEAGYINFQYDAAEELAPQEELAAEEMGIFIRRCTWTAMSQLESPTLSVAEIPQKEWFLQVSDIVTEPNPADDQPAPIDPNNINTATGEVYPPHRIKADEIYGNPPYNTLAGDLGGVIASNGNSEN